MLSRFISTFLLLAATLDTSNAAPALRSRKLQIPFECQIQHYLNTSEDEESHRERHRAYCEQYWQLAPSNMPSTSASPSKIPTSFPFARKFKVIKENSHKEVLLSFFVDDGASALASWQAAMSVHFLSLTKSILSSPFIRSNS